MMAARKASPRAMAFASSMADADRHARGGNLKAAFAALERAHVLGQRDFLSHLRVHGRMLRIGWRARDVREVVGQITRLALVPLGHVSGRLPLGNTGGANVDAFAPMPIPPDLAHLLEERDR